MSLLKTNEIQNYNGSSLTLTASTVSTSAQLNTGGNVSVTGSLNVSDDSTTRTNLGLGTIATQDSNNVNLTGGTIGSGVVFPSFVGMIASFAMSSAPTGWILCNGAQYAIADYGDLYTAIGTTWGALTNGSDGAGSSHFRVPDLQGAFLRGSGNGTIDGRTKAGGSVGNFNEDQLQNAQGSVVFNDIAFYAYPLPVSSAQGVFTSSGSFASEVARRGTGAADSTGQFLNFSLSNVARTGSETHPYNATVQYCIKY